MRNRGKKDAAAAARARARTMRATLMQSAQPMMSVLSLSHAMCGGNASGLGEPRGRSMKAMRACAPLSYSFTPTSLAQAMRAPHQRTRRTGPSPECSTWSRLPIHPFELSTSCDATPPHANWRDFLPA
jgi:hypothetical protein